MDQLSDRRTYFVILIRRTTLVWRLFLARFALVIFRCFGRLRFRWSIVLLCVRLCIRPFCIRHLRINRRRLIKSFKSFRSVLNILIYFNHPISSNKHPGSYLKFKLKGGWGVLGGGGRLLRNLSSWSLKIYIIKMFWQSEKKGGGTCLILWSRGWRLSGEGAY